MPVVYDYIYQNGDYWFYFDKKNKCFTICRDNTEKGFAEVIAQTTSLETAKEMIGEVKNVK